MTPTLLRDLAHLFRVEAFLRDDLTDEDRARLNADAADMERRRQERERRRCMMPEDDDDVFAGWRRVVG